MSKYERHIKELCRKHRIQICFDRTEFASNPYYRIIWIKGRVRTIRPYTVVLHEIGHILNESDVEKNMWKYLWQYRDAGMMTSKFTMPLEVEAWKTAKKLAKWWNDTASKNAITALFSYWIGYNLFHKKPYRGINNRLLGRVMEAMEWDKSILREVATDLFDEA